MKFDGILKEIGEFGRFQIMVYTLVCIASAISAMVEFSQVFTSASVDHWCAVSEWSDEVDECQQKDQSLYLSCMHQLRDASIPLEEESERYSKCSRYDTDYPQNWYQGYSARNNTNITGSCEDGWVYDRSQYKSSAVMEVSQIVSLLELNYWAWVVGLVKTEKHDYVFSRRCMYVLQCSSFHSLFLMCFPLVGF
ncbi:Solute carrier family 22 member 9 [Holothuria leucospilota]|uniref:Solute carrier family 22 member 9 n=1 Tax=Holothuria leucospilota TaxID=206669 RepID=A0A9Q1BM19_HOLLE|nr:Solute carrier family 22 member 9 [Holothuria leucospilota]